MSLTIAPQPHREPPPIESAGVAGDSTAELLDAMDSSELGPYLDNALGRVARFDQTALLRYRRSHPPRFLFHSEELGPRSRSERSEERGAYLEGIYLVDAYYRAFVKGCRAGFYPVRLLQAQRLEHPKYPFGWMDHAAYLVPTSHSDCLSFCVVRGPGSPPFEPGDLANLQRLEQSVCAILRLHWKLHAAHERGEAHPEGLDVKVENAVASFGHPSLTQREAEVLRLILRGHTMKSAGVALGIATTTAALHRKRAYAKLEICSMGELFNLFIRSLGSD